LSASASTDEWGDTGYASAGYDAEWGLAFTASANGTFTLHYNISDDNVSLDTGNLLIYGFVDGKSVTIQQGGGEGSYSAPITEGTDYSFTFLSDAYVETSPDVSDVGAGSTAQIDWEVAPEAPTITPSLAYQTGEPGIVGLGYTIGSADLPEPTTVDLYWASGTTPNTEIGGPIATETTGTAQAAYIDIPEVVGNPPKGAKYLIAVADPNNTISPADPSKVAAWHFAPVWTGLGPDNLWSDGLNWLGDIAPGDGASLVFPAGSNQLSNQNDLGYTFDSITVSDSYTFSGNPIDVSGDFSFTSGSSELDASATVNGDTNVDDGAALTVGAGTTLDDGFNLTGNGKLSVLGSVDLTANASVGSDATIDVEGSGNLTVGEGTIANIAGNISILGDVTVDGQMDLLPDSTCNANAKWNVSASGSITVQSNAKCVEGPNSETDIVGDFTIAPGGNLTAGLNSTTKQSDGSTVSNSGSLTIAPGSNWQLIGQSVMTDADGSTTTVNGSVNVANGTKVTADVGAAWKDGSGSNLGVYGQFINNGTWQIDANGNVILNNGGSLTFGGKATSNGDITANASYGSPYDRLTVNGQLTVSGPNAKLFIGANDVLTGTQSGQLEIGLGAEFDNHGKVSGLLTISDNDSITVESGAILDVGGTLTEGVGGQLTDGGTVVIEPGAVFNNRTASSITAGGVLRIDGTATMTTGSSLDNYGTLTIDPAGTLDIAGVVTNEPGSTYNDKGTVKIETGGSLILPSTSGTPVVHPKVTDVVVHYGSKSMSILNLSRDLPFSDITSIDILFSDNVVIPANAITLVGRGGRYGFNASYNPTTFDETLKFPTSLGIDRLTLALTNQIVASSAPAATLVPFRKSFSVLPGDINGDNSVNSLDLVAVRNGILGTLDQALDVWADIDGNGTIGINDYSLVKKYVGKKI